MALRPKFTARVNGSITASRVHLIDTEATSLGIVPTERAQVLAYEQGLDLVEVGEGDGIPVCRLLDYGKFRYEQQKKLHNARRQKRSAGMKEIKFRPNIDQHDFDVKMRAIRKFLDSGDRVKVTLRFRGRELSHQHLGQEVLDKITDTLKNTAKVETSAVFERRQITMILAPR